MKQILSLLIFTIFLSGCDLYNFDKSPKDNPGGGGTGTVGDAKDLSLLSGANQVGLLNIALGSAYEVKVLDSKSRPIVGETITFTVLDQNSVQVLTQTATTDSNGIASLNITPTVFGRLSVKIEPSTSSNVVSPLLVPVKVIGPADSISIVSGNNQTIDAGSALNPVKFLIKDANGELVPNATATINGSAVSANTHGEVNFTLSNPNTLTGSYNFNATLANSASLVVSYSVIPSSPASLTITGGNNQSLVAGTSAGVMSASLKDSSGNTIPNYVCGTVISDFNGDLTLTPTTTPTLVGSYSEVLSCGPLSATFNYAVTVGPLASLEIVSGDNQTITAGTALATMSVVAKDAFTNARGNDSVDFSGTTTSTNASGVASYNGGVKNTSGSFTVTASSGGLSKTFSYTVNPSAPATLTIISGNNQNLISGDTASSMVVELKDAQNNLIPNATISFSGNSVTTNGSGLATYNPGTKTVAGSFTVTATINSLSQTFSYTVVAGPLASLVIDSGNNQVLPRSVSSNSLVLKGYDAALNAKSGPTVSWSDGVSWSTTSVLTSGSTYVVYPTPLLTGNKTITASSGSVSVSFTLTVNNYAPLTATISSSDDLTYSAITSRTIVNADRTYLGPVTVAPGSAPPSNRGWAKSGSGTQTPVDSTPGSETNLSLTITNVSSPSDILSITSTATFPSGVTANSCSLVNPAVDGLTCSVNSTMSFTRDKILGGAFQIKVQSSNLGGPEDYRLSNTLPTAKKVILEQYVFTSPIAVAGGTGKNLYMLDDAYYPSVWNIDNKTITRLASNISSGSNYMSRLFTHFYSGRFIFLGTDPSDSALRVISYDPQTDSFAVVVTVGVNDGAVLGMGYIDTNGVLNLCSTNKRNILIASDFSVTYGTSAGSTGCWNTVFSSGGSDYGVFTVVGTGIYRRTGTAMTRLGLTFYSGSPITFPPVTTTSNGYIIDPDNGVFSMNATTMKKLSSTGAVQGKALTNKVVIATKDSAGKNKIFVYNEADSSYKKLRDFNGSGDDFITGNLPLLGIYNGNAYMCVTVGSTPTIFQYDGTTLKQLAQVGSCTRIRETSAVVDNALWFNLNNSLTRICDTSAGCQ
ncbi:MAG: Ig-like domain-containing protein [Bdellovibrionaceae bacterium]|nr:Ig-like domain-containing protein [Pseudobdellovibrionaceae bacterium]